MNKKIKKLNEFRDVEFEIEAETEIKVLSDSEIEKRRVETGIRMKEALSKCNKPKKQLDMSMEYFENTIIKRMYEYPNTTKNDIDQLSIKFFGKPYYKNNDEDEGSIY